MICAIAKDMVQVGKKKKSKTTFSLFPLRTFLFTLNTYFEHAGNNSGCNSTSEKHVQFILQIYITAICLREGEDVFLLSEYTMEVLLLCFFNVGTV